MALVVYAVFRFLGKRVGKLPSQIIGSVLAECLMILGYFVFEGFLYGFGPSLVNIPANAVQGAAGLILGLALARLFEKMKITLD
jgi:uncharacterized membrane protein